MSRLGRERLVRAGLVSVLLVGVLVATFGAGYRSSEAVLDAASAFLQRDSGVRKLNAVTGDTEAEAALELASGDQELEVVEVSPGVVYVLNAETKQVWRMPTDTLRPEPVVPDQQPDRESPDLAGAGGRAYLLDREHGQLTLLEDRDRPATDQVPLPAGVRLDQLVVDREGTAWALSSADGTLYRIAGRAVASTHPVPHPGEPALLTLVDRRPVVYQPTAGVAVRYDRRGEQRRVAGLRPAPEQRVRVAASADTPVLVVAVRPSGELFTVDFDRGEARPWARLPGLQDARLGPPVVARGLVYLPDYTNRQVVVVDLGSLQEVRAAVPVPGQRDFELFHRDGRVWVNDPYGGLLTFDQQGRPRELDDGTGPEAAPDPTTPPPDDQDPPPPDDQDRPRPPSPPPAAKPEPVEVPDVVGLDRLAACKLIEEVQLQCTRQERDGSGGTPGAVIEADPLPGRAVPAGTEVTVHFYSGQNTVGSYVGMNIFAACGAVQGDPEQGIAGAGFPCKPVEGVTAWGTGQACATVYQQSPAPGTRQRITLPVELTYYSCNQDLPGYAGGDVTAACNDLVARGFQCNLAETLHPSTNLVVAQDQPAGRYPLGSVITIRYSPWQIVDWWIVRSGNGWAMRSGPPPEGVEGYRVGGAYAAHEPLPVARTIYQYLCTAGNGQCRGLDHNLFYSSISPGHVHYPQVDPDFQPPTPFAVFMTCDGTPGQRPVYRVWNAGSPRFYAINHLDHTQLPDWDDSELLGCVW